jgi:hypothetical protein
VDGLVPPKERGKAMANAAEIYRVRIFHDGALYTSRTSSHDEIVALYKILAIKWDEIKKIPGRLMIVMDDPDGVTHIWSTKQPNRTVWNNNQN